MATFLDMARATRILVGMQGTGPASVISAQGIEEVLVRMVRDAYVDVQNLREEWDFLLLNGSFLTANGKDTYTFLDIFATSIPNFKKYKKNSVRLTDLEGRKAYLQYVDRDVLEARFLNDSQKKLPTKYTVEPGTRSVILKPIPDGIYTVNFRYWRSPEILSTDTQVPLLPLPFHNLIIYKAVEKMAIYLGSPETYSKYSAEAAKMQGQLMRMYIPKRRMTAGALV